MKLALWGEGNTISKRKIFLPSIDTKAQRTLLELQLQQFFPERQFYDLPEPILILREKTNTFCNIRNWESRAKWIHTLCRRLVGGRNKNGEGSGNLRVMTMIQRQYIPPFVYEASICGSFIRSVSHLDNGIPCCETSTLLEVHAFAQLLIRGVTCDKGWEIFSDYQTAYKRNKLAILFCGLHEADELVQIKWKPTSKTM